MPENLCKAIHILPEQNHPSQDNASLLSIDIGAIYSRNWGGGGGVFASHVTN